MHWIVVWKIALIFSLSVYAVLAVVTTVFGAADIRRLFQRLKDDDSE